VEIFIEVLFVNVKFPFNIFSSLGWGIRHIFEE